MTTNTALVNKFTRAINKVGFQLKKHSPEILAITGTIGIGVTAVLTYKATRKVDKVIDKHKTAMEKIHIATEKGITEAGEEYNAEDCKKDTVITYTQTGLELAKLYGPAIMVGLASGVAVLGSHKILRGRYLAVAAAYATEHKNFKEYRDRMVDRFGADLDRELRYNIKTQEVEEKVVDENGKETIVKKTVNTIDPSTIDGESSFFFDEYCKGWTKDSEANKFFVLQVQSWATQKLKADGFLSLNDVFDAMGIDKTKQGQLIGWVYDESDPERENFVDFGLYRNPRDKGKMDFVNGRERSVLLEPNVHGNLYSLMK